MAEDDSLTEVDKVLAGQKQELDATKSLIGTLKSANKLQSEYTKQISSITQMLGMKRKFGIAKDPEMVAHLKAVKAELLQIKKDLRAAQKKDVQKAIKTAGGQATGHHWMQSFKTSMSNMFAPLTKAFKPISSALGKIGSKVSGSLKKSGMMPMLGMAGAGLLAGVMGKVISSSPLLQSMMKMLNMGMTLIFRPIGDFIGSIMRPLMISFIKDIAVPFFKASKNMMKEGEKIGKGLLGFFTDPIKAMQAAIILGLHSVLPAEFLGGKGVITEAKAFQANPTAFARRGAGVGEFTRSKSFSIVPTDAELLDAGYSTEEINNMDEFRTGYSWRKVQKARENDLIPEDYGERRDWMGNIIPGSAKSERIFGSDKTSVGGVTGGITAGGIVIPPPVYVPTGGDQTALDDKTKADEEAVEEQEEHNDETEQANEETEQDRDTEHEIRDEGNQQLEQDIEDGGYIQDTYNKNNRKHNVAVVAATTELTETTQEATATWWDHLLGFFGVSDKATEQKVQETEQNKTIQDKEVEQKGEFIDSTEVLTQRLDDVNVTLQVGGLELRQTLKEVSDEARKGGEMISAAANLSTGGMFGSTKTPQTSATSLTIGTPENVLGAGYSASGMSEHLGGKTVMGVSSVMSPEQAAQVALAKTGGSPLGDYLGNKFEMSPGKFGDIYKTVDGQKVKINPTSEEGKTIQGIYNQQLVNKFRNQAQQSHVAKVGSFTTSAETKAYLMAGGGEAGIKAAALAKEHGMDMNSPAGVLALSEAVPEIKEKSPALVEEAKQYIPYTDQKLPVGESYKNLIGQSMSMTVMGGMTSVGGFTTGLGSSQKTRGSSSSTGGGAGAARSSRGSGGGSSGGTGGAGGGAGGRGSGGGGAGGSSGAGGARGGRSGGGGKSSGSKGSGGGKGSSGGRRGGGRRGQFGAIIDEPIVGIGMNTGQEWLLGESGHEVVTPVDDYEGGVGNIIIHIGNITKEADYMKLKPLIQRWILEASSRRGIV